MTPAHPRSLPAVLAGLAALVAGCTSVGQMPPGERLLIAEVAVERGEYALAAHEYRQAASVTGDPAIAERAARVAFDNAQDRELARTATEWLGRDPKNEAPRRFLAVAEL